MAFIPDDLRDASTPDTDKNYFNVVITDLELNTEYPLQFRWQYEDKTYGEWSAVKTVTTASEDAPNTPGLGPTDVIGGPGFIKIIWNGKDNAGNDLKNIDRVDIYITGGTFGAGNEVADSFRVAGTKTIAAAPGIYIVQLRAVTLLGTPSNYSITRTVTVTAVGEEVQEPTNPNGFSSKRILAGVEVSWAGTYANGTFTGFEAIQIYAGTSAAATAGTYTQVGVLTGNNVKNTIVVPVDGVYVKYGQATYIHAAAVNKNGTIGTIQANVTNQPLGPGKASDQDINDGAIFIEKLAADVLTVGNLKAGDINSTSYIRAGTASSARVEISSSTVGSVLPGLTVYNSQGDQILRAPLTGGLTITGSLTATQISTSSGKFSVNTSGILTATDADFSGVIKATGGYIGSTNGASGWTINSNGLQSTSGSLVLEGSTGKITSSAADPLFPTVVQTITIQNGVINISSTGNSIFSNGAVTISGRNLGGQATNSAFTSSAIFFTDPVSTGSMSMDGSGNLLFRAGPNDSIRFSPDGGTATSAGPIVMEGLVSAIYGFTGAVYTNSGSSLTQTSGNRVGAFRNIGAGTGAKTSSDTDGLLGDIWIQYT